MVEWWKRVANNREVSATSDAEGPEIVCVVCTPCCVQWLDRVVLPCFGNAAARRRACYKLSDVPVLILDMMV